MLHSAVPSSHVAAVLNGSIVGLAAAQPEPAGAGVVSSADGAPLQCLGVGIVRAVDASKQLLYILTDVPADDLENVRILQVLNPWLFPG